MFESLIILTALALFGFSWPRMADDDAGLDDESGSPDEDIEDDPEEPADEDPSGAQQVEDAIDDTLIAEAANRGLTREDVEAFGSAAAARRAMSMIDRQVGSLGKQFEQRLQQLAQQNRQTTQQPPQRAPSQSDFKVDPEVFGDENIANHIQAMHEYHAQRYQTLEQQAMSEVQAIRQQMAAQQSERLMERFDTLVASWSEKFGDSLGKGDTMDLPQGTPAAETRQQILMTMAGMHKAYEMAGQKPPKFEVLATRARDAVLGEKIQSIARQQVGRQVAKRAAQVTPRGAAVGPQPPRRPRDEAEADRRAIAAIGRKAKEMGINI